mmetsp:Transcript_29692/g.67222  ORF Transcript_29692/g.67222 Transcript_29692/m.67222 type:complete len:627 (+) Transcript_29692:89-1969(+)|eukprot:CAMPEP_0197899576 /NCGR_PEP_ID=MMETSP1439-20131203/46857_1 /TAXON_ID=66791 /ORGANISM="Gonyaulax spinifera, Strain CCMP409" /LENGTH=626 /DNA_ID=CAMNT_0043520389 /DNA_START=89 /DNA_END=1969 /DNA_ORIENTATION=-
MVYEGSSAIRVRSRSPSPDRSIVHTGINLGDKAARTIEISNEDGTESILIGATSKTTTSEVQDILGWYTSRDGSNLRLIDRGGTFVKQLRQTDEVATRVTCIGIKSFKREVAKLEHTIVVIGAGLGGIQTMINLRERGRSDIVCFEKLGDFGGHSWIVVSNKFTKLQTEKGSYHVDYFLPQAEVPHSFGDVEYKTWPSRDMLLTMFRQQAGAHGLYDCTQFHTCVEKVKPLPGFGKYTLATTPTNSDDDAEMMLGSAVLSWPGNLCDCRMLEFPGEDAFGGYIEYSSFCKVDYSQVEGKNVILYGHGAFTIENVRTLVEHKCKKVVVMCRKRNLCGMKMISWMSQQAQFPVAGHILMEGFQIMYDLVNFDVWTAHSVKTDANRTFAHVSQRTVFGVTDVYFLAGYFGLMEVLVDEVKRLSHNTVHTKKGKKVDAQVIIKAIGTVPSFKIDKMLGLKDLAGFWVNHDCMRPVLCNGMFVEARNFASFSSGPGFASQVHMINWFVDWPSDFENCKANLPVNKASDRPAYVPGSSHMLPAMTAVQQGVPALAQKMAEIDGLKSYKMRQAHPLPYFLHECRQEWEAYCKFFRANGMVDDRPDPPYPYSEEKMHDMMGRSDYIWMKRQGMA